MRESDLKDLAGQGQGWGCGDVDHLVKNIYITVHEDLGLSPHPQHENTYRMGSFTNCGCAADFLCVVSFSLSLLSSKGRKSNCGKWPPGMVVDLSGRHCASAITPVSEKNALSLSVITFFVCLVVLRMRRSEV